MFKLIPLSEITESPSNPRQIRSKEADAELLANVREVGILEPLLVRPAAGMYELVFGARRLAAARALSFESVSCVVREMTDEQALEAQLAENLRREDMHPADEAEAYRRLRDEYAHDSAYIANKLGVSRKKIDRRLQLCSLSKSARAAFRKGVIELGIAEAISRMPDEGHQHAVLKLIDANNFRVTVESVRAIIARDYMLDLVDAPFDTEDDALVPGCGSCSACPKRSTNTKKLWDEIEDGDRCTDQACYKRKNEAAWSSARMMAEVEGNTIATSAQNRTIFGHGSTVLGGYVALDQPARDDERKRTWRRLVGKSLKPDQIILARSPRGHAVEVITTEVALDLARAAGLPWADRAEDRAPSSPEKQARELEKIEIERRTKRSAADAAIESARKLGLDERFLEFVAGHAIASCSRLSEIYQAQGVLGPDIEVSQEGSTVMRHLKKLEVGARVAEVLRMLVSADGTEGEEDAATIYDVDIAAIKKTVREAVKAERTTVES